VNIGMASRLSSIYLKKLTITGGKYYLRSKKPYGYTIFWTVGSSIIFSNCSTEKTGGFPFPAEFQAVETTNRPMNMRTCQE
jgi:hypothetical protein